MKALLSTFTASALVFISCSCSGQQWFQQYFDGADTASLNSIQVVLDTGSTNVWHIAPPQKILFDSAYSLPNVIITDSLLAYPDSSTSSFTVQVTEENSWGPSIIALQWAQKLDLENGRDGGMIEFSFDNGQTWASAFDNPLIYNFYGYDNVNVDTLHNGLVGFTGIDTNWRDIWLCYDSYFFWEALDSIRVRFTFTSDTVSTGQEGWMIDNMTLHRTWVHTINKMDDDVYMRVFPNPAKGRINIETRKIQAYHAIERAELFNMAGLSVRTFGRRPTKTFLDVSGIPAGVYHLKVHTNIRSETFKVVIEND